MHGQWVSVHGPCNWLLLWHKMGDDRQTYGFDEFLGDEPILARNNQYLRVEREAKRYFIKDNEADQHQKS